MMCPRVKPLAERDTRAGGLRLAPELATHPDGLGVVLGPYFQHLFSIQGLQPELGCLWTTTATAAPRRSLQRKLQPEREQILRGALSNYHGSYVETSKMHPWRGSRMQSPLSGCLDPEGREEWVQSDKA